MNMNSQTFAIGVLSTTAAIFLAALLIISSRPEPAFASGMTTQGGNYGLTVGRGPIDEEIVYVIDAATERIVAYRFDQTQKLIQVVQGFELRNLRIPRDKAGKPRPAGRRSGGSRP